MINDFYIDESGSSGDLANDKENLSFGEQPIFSLCAVGIKDEQRLIKKIDELKSKHKIQLKELKSHKLFKRNKYTFAADLINFLLDNNEPIFLEVVDKKYFICNNIVNCIIFPPYFMPKESNETIFLRKHTSNLLYMLDSKVLYDAFLCCCSSPSEESLINCFDVFFQVFDEKYKLTGIQEYQVIAHSINESKDDFYKLSHNDNNAYKKFIPLPDKNKHGKDVWLLPNLSSYCNIYARINKYKKGELSDVTLIHDEQKQFDEILLKNHLSNLSSCSELAFCELVLGSGDYSFVQDAKLTFEADDEHLGIQVADVVAGFFERYFRKVYINKNDNFDDDTHLAFRRLCNSWCSINHTGINSVVPHS
jgi:hypothetical protein